jgi:predicted Rossmann fold flavoprotein
MGTGNIRRETSGLEGTKDRVEPNDTLSLIAKKLGHHIQEPLAALAPIYFEKKPKHDWIGVSLRSVGLIARTSNSTLKASGDVLITHLGISGPACLSLSRSVAELIHSMNQNSALTAAEKITNIFIDFMESKSAEEIEHSFLNYANQFSTQQVKTHISTLLPNAFIEDFFSQASAPLDIKWNVLSKPGRKKIVAVLKSFLLGSVREVPIEKGEVSAGGVSLKEVDSKTMRSRIVKNLFFAGEILDIAGEVGGFNLQAAYSTGWVAGEHAALQLLDESI